MRLGILRALPKMGDKNPRICSWFSAGKSQACEGLLKLAIYSVLLCRFILQNLQKLPDKAEGEAALELSRQEPV